MIVKAGESRVDQLKSGTYDSITIIPYLVAAAVNNKLATSDFSPTAVNIKVVLKRRQRTHILMQDNLQILGTFNALRKGYHEFVNGFDKVYPTVSKKNVLIRPVRLNFGGPIRINAGDELVIELGAAQVGTFTSNVDATQSYVEFFANPCVGYETGIFSTRSHVIQAGQNKEPINPGDNVTEITFLNFDKNDLENEVITSLQLSSDRLDLSLSFNQLLERQIQMYSDEQASRFGSVLPISASDSTGRAFKGLNYLPQSFNIISDTEVDQARVDIAFNSANVAGSQNYLVYRSYITDKETLVEAKRRQEKHFHENVSKLPEAVAV